MVADLDLDRLNRDMVRRSWVGQSMLPDYFVFFDMEILCRGNDQPFSYVRLELVDGQFLFLEQHIGNAGVDSDSDCGAVSPVRVAADFTENLIAKGLQVEMFVYLLMAK